MKVYRQTRRVRASFREPIQHGWDFFRHRLTHLHPPVAQRRLRGMVEDASWRHRPEPNPFSRYQLVLVVSTIILLAIMASMTHLSLAVVYECRDARGKSVLTNRQVGLHSCRSIIKEATPVPTSPAANNSPQQPLATAIPNESSHAADPSTVFPSLPNDGPDSAPPAHSSCRSEVNPLNPLIATPCAQPDPSPQSFNPMSRPSASF
jgi:hypothetical protein